jgi:glycosyltransferase involved in cell wall biosynthesis
VKGLRQVQDKKNIYHFISDFKHGGVEVAARSSILHMNNESNFYIVVIGKVHKYFIESLSADEKSKIIEINYKSYKIFNQIIYFLLFLHKHKPDVFILSLWKASFLGIFLRVFYKKTIYISFIHNTKYFHALDSVLSRVAINKFDYIFVDSISTREFVLQENKYAKIRIISFLFQKFKYTQKIFSIGNIKILYLGRLSKQKRIDRAINVINELKNNGLEIKFDIYGNDDGEKNNIKNLISKYSLEDNIKILDPVDPKVLKQLFDKYNYYLQLSDDEGMAMSVTEAMSNGLVCFVTPVGEIKNYSEDMYSAIHLKSNYNNFINNIINVIHNKDKSEFISKNANKSFKNKEIYSDSLNKTINLIMEDKT